MQSTIQHDSYHHLHLDINKVSIGTFYVRCWGNQKNWKTSSTYTARIKERFFQQFIIKLFKMIIQRAVQTHAYCKIVCIPKCGDSLVFSTIKFHHENCQKKRLSKVIPHFNNAVIDKVPYRVCNNWCTDLSNKNCWFPRRNYYSTATYKRE